MSIIGVNGIRSLMESRLVGRIPRYIPVYRSPGSFVWKKNVTKSDQIWGIQKTRLCKVFENQQLTKPCCAPGGNTYYTLNQLDTYFIDSSIGNSEIAR